jgi:hypothetical protein
MSYIKVLAGDFLNDEFDTTPVNTYSYLGKTLTLKTGRSVVTERFCTLRLKRLL